MADSCGPYLRGEISQHVGGANDKIGRVVMVMRWWRRRGVLRKRVDSESRATVKFRDNTNETEGVER
jgi:hypothetical protein